MGIWGCSFLELGYPKSLYDSSVAISGFRAIIKESVLGTEDLACPDSGSKGKK